MVRFEKLLYEQFLNINTLKRGRSITTPSKWYSENRFDAMQVAAQKFYLSGISGKIFRIAEPLISKFTFRWYQDIAHQRGLALEDFFLHEDRQLRRCAFWEKIVRDSCHPYQWLFFKRRRARFYKVDRGCRGVTMPDYIRQEAADRLFVDTVENKEVFENFIYKEYMSDLTPNFHWSVLGKWTVLDIIIPHGIWRAEAYDRYFLNEAYYDEYTQQDVANANSAVYPQDLTTDSGKAAFEAEVNRFHRLYPNCIGRAGEQLNFQKYYASLALASGKDLASYDSNTIQELKSELAQLSDSGESSNNTGKAIGKQGTNIGAKPEGSGYFAK